MRGQKKRVCSGLLALLLIFALALTGCGGGQPAEEENGAGTDNEQTAETEQEPKLLAGVIEDLTGSGLTVAGEDGGTYLVARDDSLVVSADGLLVLGRNIHVTYRGELKDQDGVQDVEIISYYVEAPPQACLNR